MEQRETLLSKTLPLLRGRISYESAAAKETDVLLELSYPQKRFDFYVYLHTHIPDIEAIVSRHLRLSNHQTCHVGEVKEWIHGSFNVCIPVYIDNWDKGSRVLMRVPLPYKVGESVYSGNADEKLRCEAATFIWIRENCPDVPIPYLWGFGCAGGLDFISQKNVSFWTRLVWYVGSGIQFLFRSPLPCQYIPCRFRQDFADTGYLIMDYIEEEHGKMLSETWQELSHLKELRANLFQDISRIMLSLSRIALPRIGCLTINDFGVLSLTNRPLTIPIIELENEGHPASIRRDRTYSTVQPYLLDLLAYHDNRIRFQRNAIFSKADGVAQLAALTMMRSSLPIFTNRDLNEGPFFLTLTDLHQSNIFVDDKWRVKTIVDLEWTCSLPVELQSPPYWLTSQGIDQLTDENLDEYGNTHDEFVSTYEREERRVSQPFINNTTSGANIMRRGWMTGSLWYFWAINSPTAVFNLFNQHIQPRFPVPPDHSVDKILAGYWNPDAFDIIETKLRDKEAYDTKLKKVFESSEDGDSCTKD